MKGYKQAGVMKYAMKAVSLDLRPIQGWLNNLAEVARRYNEVVMTKVVLMVHPDGRAELLRLVEPRKPVWRELEEVLRDG
jgi:hypothetical protein